MTAALVAAALFVFPLPAPGSTQAAAHAAEVIADVRVHGNHITSSEDIVRLSGLNVGSPFQASTLDEITRRLVQDGRFDDVQVLKRFASIADPHQILVVIVVNEGPVRIELPDEPGGVARVVKRRGLRNLMVMPILFAEDGYGLTYGVRVAQVSWLGGRSRVSVPVSWGGLKQVGVEVDRTFDAGPLSRVRAGADLRRQINPAFDEDDDRRRVWARAERNVAVVRAGGEAGWQHVSFAAEDDTFRTIGADVTYDTRRSPLLPRNAVLASASWEHVTFGSGGSVDRTKLDARAYVGLVGQVVLEVRAWRHDASRPVPAYLKSLLGGWSSLRGFRAGQFVGDTVVGGTGELRVPLSSALSVGKVGVSAFVDSGVAYDKGQRFGDAAERTGIGGSVWLTLAAFQMNLSVAHGRRGDTRVNFGGGFVF